MAEDIMFAQMSLSVLAQAATKTNVTVAIVVAALGAVATVSVGLLNFFAQRRSFRAQQELTRSSQITQNLTKAIDQLGSDNKGVRIGGIYALERIARESKQDRPQIASTLTTFIQDSQPAAAVREKSYIPVLKTRAPDVQVALTVLCRSPLCDERVKPNSKETLDLSRTDLRRASLSGAHLERVNLWAARLEGADLRGAHLQGAVLQDAHLGRFDPKNPRYKAGADLSGADLTGARLSRAIDLKVAKTMGTRGLTK
jgi:hypothetical protein